MKCSCKVCKELFEDQEVYITDNGEYVCKNCQGEHNFKLTDLELLKKIGSKDCRN